MGTFTIIKTDKRAGDIEEFNRINKIYSRWLYQFHSHVCRLNDKFQAGITGNNHDYNCISFSGAKCIALKHDYRRLTKKLGIERGDNHEDVKQDPSLPFQLTDNENISLFCKVFLAFFMSS